MFRITSLNSALTESSTQTLSPSDNTIGHFGSINIVARTNNLVLASFVFIFDKNVSAGSNIVTLPYKFAHFMYVTAYKDNAGGDSSPVLLAPNGSDFFKLQNPLTSFVTGNIIRGTIVYFTAS